MQKINFKVNDMKCGNCTLQLERIEDELAGIRSINASYHKQQMAVEFNEKIVSVEQIIQAARQKGYEIIISE